tara:strand:+ start:815 stop:1207 length:393 start_codon:yes stop_codon:yes gene_type:complete
MKLILYKTWVFIKNYWYVPFVLVLILISWLVFRTSNTRMMEVLKASIQSYEKEIDILKNSHKKEIEVRDELLGQYNDIIGELEKQYEDREEELDEKKKEEVKDLVKKYENDNEALAREISEKFGVEYVSG